MLWPKSCCNPDICLEKNICIYLSHRHMKLTNHVAGLVPCDQHLYFHVHQKISNAFPWTRVTLQCYLISGPLYAYQEVMIHHHRVCQTLQSKFLNSRLIIIIIIIIIWFGDTVNVSHFTKCNTNSIPQWITLRIFINNLPLSIKISSNTPDLCLPVAIHLIRLVLILNRERYSLIKRINWKHMYIWIQSLLKSHS